MGLTISELLNIISKLAWNLAWAGAFILIGAVCSLLYLGYKAHQHVREGAELPEGSLPCPYCGSHNLKVQRLMKHYNVVCCNCNTDYPGYDTLEEAIEDWNWEEEENAKT